MKKKRARVIAFYLPQFHPIPENDLWWGKGFTEWTNVGRAKPLFRGHYQPRVPADLGYYDLRLPEIREAQAEMAREAGIEGFCYWHYWFGNGKQLLERPFNEVLESGQPDFPFCLGWANHSWVNKSWTAVKSSVQAEYLCRQEYSTQDVITHFYNILPAFKDKRYITIDGKPIFVVFNPLEIPNAHQFIATWNKLASENGLKGVYFIGITSNFQLRNKTIDSPETWNLSNYSSAKFLYNKILNLGFDGVNPRGETRAQVMTDSFLKYYFKRFLKIKLKFNFVTKYNYEKIIKHLFVEEDKWNNVYPTIIPAFDRSPRSGNNENSIIWHKSTPELFKKHVEEAVKLIQNKRDEHKILFLMSWNEWGECNYIEPDIVFGKGYLNVLKEVIFENHELL